MRNVTSKKRLKDLSHLYGHKEWKHLGAEEIAAAGDLIEVDLMYLQVGGWVAMKEGVSLRSVMKEGVSLASVMKEGVSVASVMKEGVH